MRILALESSGTQGSVAILESGVLLAQAELPPSRRSAQTLIPAVAEQLSAVGWKPADIQLVAVTQGPGSFTGLRVGITAAKTLAYAVRAEVLGVDTLEVIAAQAPAEESLLWAVIDAQREQLFAALLCRRPNGQMSFVEPTHIVDTDAWLAALQPGMVVAGPGLSRVAARLPPTALVSPQETWQPLAATVGRLAWRDCLAGRRGDLWKLSPNYYRTSAAEEKKRK